MNIGFGMAHGLMDVSVGPMDFGFNRQKSDVVYKYFIEYFQKNVYELMNSQVNNSAQNFNLKNYSMKLRSFRIHSAPHLILTLIQKGG